MIRILYGLLNIFPIVGSRKSHRQPPDHYLPSSLSPSTRPWFSGRTIDRLRMQLPNWCARSTALRTRLSMQGIINYGILLESLRIFIRGYNVAYGLLTVGGFLTVLLPLACLSLATHTAASRIKTLNSSILDPYLRNLPLTPLCPAAVANLIQTKGLS